MLSERIAVRKVHTASTVVEAAHLRSVLEAAGIACFVRNEGLVSAIGELPFVECWPEVWVVHNRDVLEARGLIDSVIRAPALPPGADWICRECGERVEGQFDACWRCSAERDGDGTGQGTT